MDAEKAKWMSNLAIKQGSLHIASKGHTVEEQAQTDAKTTQYPQHYHGWGEIYSHPRVRNTTGFLPCYARIHSARSRIKRSNLLQFLTVFAGACWCINNMKMCGCGIREARLHGPDYQ